MGGNGPEMTAMTSKKKQHSLAIRTHLLTDLIIVDSYWSQCWKAIVTKSRRKHP